MTRLRELPQSSAAHWVQFGSAGIGLAVIALTPARDVFVSAYETRWPLALLAGILTAGLIIIWLRGGGGGTRIIRGHDRIQQELESIVEAAHETLICVGSRSRDREYLIAIEDRVRQRSALRHLRILCGDPHRAILRDHLGDLMTMRASDPARAGRIRVGLCTLDDEPEQSICANENRACVVVPALGDYGRYDSAIVVSNRQYVKQVHDYAEAMFASGESLNDAEAIESLRLVKP